jgi:hypothetical protein
MVDKLDRTEYEHQAAVIRWARTMAAAGESRLDLLHGDSSGVRVPIGCAVKIKAAGAIKGWPDLFLPVPEVDPFKPFLTAGLFIELKRSKGGRLTVEQSMIHRRLREQGYRVEVCLGAEEAIKCLKDYLGLKIVR